MFSVTYRPSKTEFVTLLSHSHLGIVSRFASKLRFTLDDVATDSFRPSLTITPFPDVQPRASKRKEQAS